MPIGDSPETLAIFPCLGDDGGGDKSRVPVAGAFRSGIASETLTRSGTPRWLNRGRTCVCAVACSRADIGAGSREDVCANELEIEKNDRAMSTRLAA